MLNPYLPGRRTPAAFLGLLLSFLVFTGSQVRAQSGTQNLSGRWVGVFDVIQADGSVVPDVAYLQLQQDAGKLTGGAGNDASKLSPIANGQLGQSRVTFDVVVNPAITVHFNLALDGDHLRGTATGVPVGAGDKIAIDVERWPDGASQPTVPHAQSQLFTTVAALDTKLFDAYNHCDLATMSSLVAEDLEFYHDKTGLSVGRQTFIDAIKNNICGKTQRTLVPGTLEVYPLANYGAVEIGVHRFTHPSNPEIGVGEGKFITVWRFKDGAWQMTRAISYDHEPAKEQ
jgi:hypothetical protein